MIHLQKNFPPELSRTELDPRRGSRWTCSWTAWCFWAWSDWQAESGVNWQCYWLRCWIHPSWRSPLSSRESPSAGYIWAKKTKAKFMLRFHRKKWPSWSKHPAHLSPSRARALKLPMESGIVCSSLCCRSRVLSCVKEPISAGMVSKLHNGR